MSLTLQSLAENMRPFHNDICIVHDCELGRLVGVAEDDSDLYYMVARMSKGVGYYSAVGSCVSLRGHYPDAAYARLDGVHEFNRAQKTEAFERLVLPGGAFSSTGECA